MIGNAVHVMRIATGEIDETPEPQSAAREAIIQAMLRAYPGSPGAYNYGPICVAESHRGQGLALAMFEQLRAQLPGREGFTFIRADNVPSRNVHTKMGMQEVAEFALKDITYVVVAYQG